MRNAPACAGLALALAAPTALAEHHMRYGFGGDLGFGYDDNVGSAARDGDVRDSGFVSGGLNLDVSRRLTSAAGLLLRGSLRADAYADTEGLSNAKAGALVRLAWRPQGGFHTPTFAGWVSGALWEFDSALRDSLEARAGVHVSVPLTTAVGARVSVGVAERMGDADVFDLSSWSAGLSLDWRVVDALTLYAGYQRHDGDIVSSGGAEAVTTAKSTHDLGGGGGDFAYAEDDALDGLTAYRVEAQTRVAVLGMNVPLSERLALDAQVQQVDSDTDYGAGYERLQGVVSALMRF